MLYGDLHVQQALALVAASEAYSEVLLLEAEPRVEGHADDDDDEQPQVLQAAAPNPVLNAAIIKSKDRHVEGEVPPHFLEQASYSSHASTSLCLENQEQYTRLVHYMYSRGEYDCVPVAPDGSCLFSSLRRIISAPFEYRNIHLRRQLVVTLANHKEFFFNLLKEHIRGTYGFPRLSEEEYQQKYDDGLLTDQEVQDHNCPGPFSFHSYLSALLDPEMWGDEQVLCLCSMMWQIGPDVVVCPFCSRKCRSHQKLVSHCKRCHCQSLALKCTSCNKVFGDSYALKIHMRLHSSSERVNKCNICGKAYLTKSKLNEHSKVHTIGRLPCEHCNKLFAESKTLSVHKKTCSKHPGADNLTEEEKKPHKCPHCTKRYTHASDVVRHCKSKHPGI